MSAIATIPNPQPVPLKLPTHLDLPDTDGKPVDNTYQPTQWKILQDSLTPWMWKLHPDGQFLVAMDHGIYFKIADPPLDGCRVADLLVVEDVPPIPDDYIYRRSYIMWQDLVAPTLITELVSGDGKEERDRTPKTGKFWIYEKLIKAGYYVIYDPDREILEVHELAGTSYRPVLANERGHYPIPQLRIEVGLVHGTHDLMTLTWLRFFDSQGNMLPIPQEIVVQEKQRADDEAKRADDEAKRADDETKRAEQLEKDKEKLLKRLRELGVDSNGS
jgi:hypothetical protein